MKNRDTQPTLVKTKTTGEKVEVTFCVACNHGGEPKKPGDKVTVTKEEAIIMKTFKTINEDV